jgi:hypothetical protein
MSGSSILAIGAAVSKVRWIPKAEKRLPKNRKEGRS